MKYVLAGLAIVAGVAALFFRPPHVGSPPVPPAEGIPAAPAQANDRSDSDGRFRRPASARSHGSKSPGVIVYVAGEVVRPGIYALPAGARAEDALARAGGPKSDADLVAVNLAAPVSDGAEIAFPKIGETTPHRRRGAGPRVRAAHAPRGHGHRRSATPDPDTNPASQSIDLNSADASELETLPGIGAALAERIVSYREANGPFASVDELADVSGITPRLQDEIADFVVVR